MQAHLENQGSPGAQAPGGWWVKPLPESKELGELNDESAYANVKIVFFLIIWHAQSVIGEGNN